MNSRVGSVVLGVLAATVPACAMHTPQSDEATGTIQAAISVDGNRHDVTSVYYKVVDASSDCSAAPLAETTSALEEEALPGSVLPPGSGPHAGADGLFVLPPGNYLVCATPRSASGPSQECAPTSGTVTVTSATTTEIMLVSQCGAAASGAGDVIVGLNDPPHIDNLTISPSKFINQCEPATITVTATDPDGEAMSYLWSVSAGSGTIAGQGSTATFTPDGPGDSTIQVTVTDTLGGSSSLTFPIHVSAKDCGPPCTQFGADSFGYTGCSRTESMPSCEDISLSGAVSCSGDDCASSVPLPFNFDYYGTPRSSVYISSNGNLNFSGNSNYVNACFVPSGMIAPYWDDLYPPAGGSVRYATVGAAPARRFVVEWNVPRYGGGALYDVRAVLFEGSSDIRFCYVNTLLGNFNNSDSGASATAGLGGPGSNLMYSCNSPQLTNGLTLEFTHP